MSLNVRNTTVSGNSTFAAGLGAGAVCVWGNSAATFRSSTISGNAGGTGGGGGGIYIQNTARVDLGNTIVAGNTSPNRGADLFRFDDGRATFHSATGNVIGDNSGNGSAPNTDVFPTGNPNQNGDKVGAAGSVINPLLAPLANNGGTTPTRALLPGSGAIDAGRNSLATAFGPTTDQRGVGRIHDGNDDGTAIIDSDAFEVAGIFTVDTTADDFSLTACTAAAGDCSLRGAIRAAGRTPDADTIGFALPANSTITLTSELTIDDVATTGTLTITNSTGANNLRISGNYASRIFYVRSGANLTLNGVTVINGREFRQGAGIFVSGLDQATAIGTLTLANSIVSNNTSTDGSSGGIANYGTTTLSNSTVSDNTAAFVGGIVNQGGTLSLLNSTVSANRAIGANGGTGGIANNSGTVSLTNSTVNDNYSATGSYTGNGGGITNYAETTLTNSTVSGNMARNGGGISNQSGTLKLTGVTVAFNRANFVGGVENNSGTVNLSNTLIAKNLASVGASAPDFTGAISGASSFNLIGSGKATTGITNGTNGNQVGATATPIDPKLDPTLALNGGTTLNYARLTKAAPTEQTSAA